MIDKYLKENNLESLPKDFDYSSLLYENQKFKKNNILYIYNFHWLDICRLSWSNNQINKYTCGINYSIINRWFKLFKENRLVTNQTEIDI